MWNLQHYINTQDKQEV